MTRIPLDSHCGECARLIIKGPPTVSLHCADSLDDLATKLGFETYVPEPDDEGAVELSPWHMLLAMNGDGGPCYDIHELTGDAAILEAIATGRFELKPVDMEGAD